MTHFYFSISRGNIQNKSDVHLDDTLTMSHLIFLILHKFSFYINKDDKDYRKMAFIDKS